MSKAAAGLEAVGAVLYGIALSHLSRMKHARAMGIYFNGWTPPIVPSGLIALAGLRGLVVLYAADCTQCLRALDL